MCACVRYWPERGVVLNVCFSSEIGLVFFGCRNVLCCLAGYVNSSIGDKIYSDTLLTSKGELKFAPPSPPLCNVVRLFELLARTIKKKTTFSGGVRDGWVGVNCFALRSYPFEDNVYIVLLPTVGCFGPPPPNLKRPRSPHSSSAIKSKMTATTMHMTC